ncbi:MAG: hypothetical protein IPK13_09180 [Deltaproteobacteria bacterium]|nr:hypothetical protein [Deltaproteobacteria bacterium]
MKFVPSLQALRKCTRVVHGNRNARQPELLRHRQLAEGGGQTTRNRAERNLKREAHQAGFDWYADRGDREWIRELSTLSSKRA